MPNQFQYDVFLSHNQADKPRVRRLAERLRAAGLKPKAECRIQNAETLPSSFFIHPSLAGGLETSRSLVLCLMPAALGSDWVTLERSTVLFRDPANAGRRFIPLLLADCKLPDTLRRLALWPTSVGCKLKGLKARMKIAQGKASLRATPWVNESTVVQALKGRQNLWMTAKAERGNRRFQPRSRFWYRPAMHNFDSKVRQPIQLREE